MNDVGSGQLADVIDYATTHRTPSAGQRHHAANPAGCSTLPRTGGVGGFGNPLRRENTARALRPPAVALHDWYRGDPCHFHFAVCRAELGDADSRPSCMHTHKHPDISSTTSTGYECWEEYLEMANLQRVAPEELAQTH